MTDKCSRHVEGSGWAFANVKLLLAFGCETAASFLI